MSSSSSSGANSGFLADLFRRRVLRIIGLYLGASWTVVEFTQWITGHYLLTPTLVDLTLAALVLALPSVALLAYTHGAPGPDEWTRREKVFLPLNALVAAGILVVLFAGADLGFMTTTVIAENSNGDRIERSVPKASFQKHIALFYADQSVESASEASAEDSLSWARVAFPNLLQVELGQDPFITTIIPNDVSDDIREAGHEDGLDVPLALQREIAQKHHMGFFVFSTIQSVSDAGVTVQVRLHETKTGRSIFTKTFSEQTLPAVIDRVSVSVRRQLGLPDAHINGLPDLPVAERVTASTKALRHWACARHEIAFGTASEADAAARRAIAADSTFTLAYLARFITLRQLGKERERFEALKNVRTYKYRLTESLEYWTRTYDLIFDHKPEQAFEVARLWNKLYPENRQALTLLQMMYDRRGNYEKAAGILRKIIDLSPTPGHAQIRLGALYEKSGRYDEALEAYETYIDAYPNTSLGHRSVAGVHIQEGRLYDARDVLLRGESITPDDASLHLVLSRVYSRLNQMSDAEAYLSAAKDAASSPRMKADVYSAQIDFYERLGRINEALAVYDALWREAFLSDAQRARSYGDAAPLYVRAGHPERAEDLVERMAHHQNAEGGGTPSRLHYLSASAELALARRDTTAADSLTRTFVDLVRQLETETGYKEMAIRSYLSGRTALLAQRSHEAIDAFSRYQRLSRGQPSLDAGELLARAYHLNGDLDRAQTHFGEALDRDRGDARLRLHYARLLRDRGAYGDAIAHLDTALTIWSDADAGYQHSQEARALHDDLSPLLAGTSPNR